MAKEIELSTLTQSEWNLVRNAASRNVGLLKPGEIRKFEEETIRRTNKRYRNVITTYKLKSGEK